MAGEQMTGAVGTVAPPPVPLGQPTGADIASIAGLFNQAAAAPSQPSQPAAPPPTQQPAQPPPQQPTAPPSQPTAPPAANVPGVMPTISPFARQAADVGIELPATATDQDVVAALAARLRQVTPLANYAEAILPHANEINDFFAARGATPQAGAPASAQPQEWNVDQHFAQKWGAPQLTPEMQFIINQGLTVRDPDTGAWVAKPGYEVMVTPLLHSLNHVMNWEGDAVRKYFRGNPFAQHWQAMQDPLDRLMESKLDKRFMDYEARQRANQAFNQFDNANAPWMYQQSNSGQPMWSPQGQQFMGIFNEAQKQWTGDAMPLLNLCRLAMVGMNAMQQQSPAGTQAPGVPNAAFNFGQQQAGQPSAAELNQQRQQAFLANALNNTAQQPNGGISAPMTVTAPVVMTQRELEDFWVNEYKAANAA